MSGFSHAGIKPFNPLIVLNKLQIRPITPEDDKILSEPSMDPHGIRQFIKLVQKQQNLQQKTVSDLINLMEKLSFKNDLLEHENRNLRHSLIQKRQKKKNLTSLNLVASGEPKYGQFFSPEKVQRARDEIQIRKDAIEHQKAMNMEKKLQKKLEKEAKKEDHRQQVEKRKEERCAKKAQKEAEI